VDYTVDLEHIVLAGIPTSLDTFEDNPRHLRLLSVDFNTSKTLRLGTSISLISALIICQPPTKGTPGLRQFSRFHETEGVSHTCAVAVPIIIRPACYSALQCESTRGNASQRVVT
jgi:hypothetical protein